MLCRPDKRSAIRQNIARFWHCRMAAQAPYPAYRRSAIRQNIARFWHCRMAAQAPYPAYRLSFISACMALFQPHL
ncbi:hypothetical protein C3433_08535 [Citrobacter freundii]|nr:hypothetical protein C3433_08535 [Citrobacter freundii]